MSGTATLEGKHLKLAEKMLVQVVSLLDKVGVDYILDGGTLLGVVREKRLLPWDTDIDLSVRGDQAELLIKHRWKLWLMGYRTRVRRFKKDVGPFKKGQPRIIKIQTHILGRKRHDVIDIFVKRKIDNEYLNLINGEQLIVRNFPPEFLEQLTTVEFQDRAYKVPKDFDGYLTRIYGDWRTPVKDWDYQKDNKCIKMKIDK